MRSYSNLLLFEAVLDSISESNSEAYDLADLTLSPRLEIVEDDCETALGKQVSVTKESLGVVELATDLPLSWARAEYLLSQGKYVIGTRDLSTCTSSKGVCRKCYEASRPGFPTVSVGDIVKIDPLYTMSAESFTLFDTGAMIQAVTLELIPEDADYIYVYLNGRFLQPEEFTLTPGSNILVINLQIQEKTILTVKYINNTRSQYVIKLAGYFSGALLGMKQLPGQGSHVSDSVLTENLPQSKLEVLKEDLVKSNNVPEHLITYYDQILDPLEKALYLLFLAGVYTN